MLGEVAKEISVTESLSLARQNGLGVFKATKKPRIVAPSETPQTVNYETARPPVTNFNYSISFKDPDDSQTPLLENLIFTFIQGGVEFYVSIDVYGEEQDASFDAYPVIKH